MQKMLCIVGVSFMLACLSGMVYAQEINIDSLQQVFGTTSNTEQKAKILQAIAGYKIGKKENDSAAYFALQSVQISKQNRLHAVEASGLWQLAKIYFYQVNFSRSLQYYLQALRSYEDLKDSAVLPGLLLNIGGVYYDLDDVSRCLQYTKKAANIAAESNNHEFYTFSLLAVAAYYNDLHQPDSALPYIQKAVIEVTKAGKMKAAMNAFAEACMGKYNENLGSLAIAESYYLKSLQTDLTAYGSYYYFIYILNYQSLANIADKKGDKAKAIEYAQMALQYATLNGSPKHLQNSYHDLATYYCNINNEKAIYYYQREAALRDSLYSLKNKNDIQNMAFEEEQRQAQKERILKEAEAEKEVIIEYAGVGLFITIGIIIFLLISQTILVNEKLIRFLGVLVMLIFFEFINLVLHPIIGGITHHSPVWMLLALVLLASLLVPAHHKLEKWVLHRVVEKNKRIRLQRAKATIQELEVEAGTIQQESH